MMLIRFFRSAFRKEMLFVILLKLVGLFLLWYVCFSHPVAKELTQQVVSARYL